MMLVRMMGFGNLRVETKWQSESRVYFTSLFISYRGLKVIFYGRVVLR